MPALLNPLLKLMQSTPTSVARDKPVCRSCGSHRVRSRGKLPDAKVFAGSQLDEALPGGTLYRCLDCSLVFRHPVHGKETYDELYRKASSATWDEPGRLDQELVREMLTTMLHDGSALDIGCGTGSLLAPLADRFDAHGIEINSDAAAVAETRGVKIIGRDLAEIMAVPETFDAVIACDVIEHVYDPLELVRMMLAKTSYNGYVIISTGNAEAWSWHLAGSRFWYCYLPEHISFVSPEWFRQNAHKLGVEIVKTREFTYSPHYPLMGKMLRLALMGFFKLSPSLYYRLLPAIKRNNIPVGRGITQDHFIIVLRKLHQTST
jgi:2-polyprenyl-3-methyl-5-hydroxy-6-metoxy-1,4-benzoquinol methylase